MKPLTNCINCGGVLIKGVCPFCGADYNTAKRLTIDLDKDQVFATIIQGGKEYEAYLAHMEIEPICSEAVRNISGKLYINRIRYIRRWTLVQTKPS